jgi:hypothetical protein
MVQIPASNGVIKESVKKISKNFMTVVGYMVIS